MHRLVAVNDTTARLPTAFVCSLGYPRSTRMTYLASVKEVLRVHLRVALSPQKHGVAQSFDAALAAQPHFGWHWSDSRGALHEWMNE